jgi:hypothetical protein
MNRIRWVEHVAFMSIGEAFIGFSEETYVKQTTQEIMLVRG